MSQFQNRSSRREEAPYSLQFEPRYLGCYEVLKKTPDTLFTTIKTETRNQLFLTGGVLSTCARLKRRFPISNIARRVVAYFRDRAKKRGEKVTLSARELDVLMLLSKGYSNKEIADKLGLGIETVQSYLKHIYRKMHVHSRSEALVKYLSGESIQP